MKTIDKVENRRKSSLAKLFDFNTDSILVDEKIVINALTYLGRKYYGAIELLRLLTAKK